MQKMTLDQLFELIPESVRSEPAVIFPEEQVSFDELDQLANDIARALVGIGIGVGDNVGSLMPNEIDNVGIFLACARVGAMYVPINTRFKARELEYAIDNSDLRLLVTSDTAMPHVDFAQRLVEALPGLANTPGGAAPLLDNVCCFGVSERPGMLNSSAFYAYGEGVSDEMLAVRRAEVQADQNLLMIYSSGTTAMPKGCPMHQGQLAASAMSLGERLDIQQNEAMWCPLPMYHISGWLPLLAMLHRGGTVVSQMHFDPDTALQQFKERKIQLGFAAFPAVWQGVLSHPQYDPADLKHLRLGMYVDTREAMARAEKQLPSCSLVSVYGMTESAGAVSVSHCSDPPELRHGSVGLPLGDMEVQIRDALTREPVPLMETGVIWIRGNNVIKSYWKDPGKNEECFDADGWFYTGDLGSLDEAGNLYFRGRDKDMIKIGGENVAAIEIEELISTHPAVKLCAVIGVPDNRLSEVAAVYIECRPGFSLEEEELLDFCRRELSAYKVPRYARFIEGEQWPMSATKIKKNDLREQLMAELGLV